MTIGQYAKVIDIAEEKGKVIQLKYNFMDSIKDVIKCEIESFVGMYFLSIFLDFWHFSHIFIFDF